MNIHTGQWDEKLSEIFGVDLNSLPQIVDSNASLWRYRSFRFTPSSHSNLE
ncbi:hypothetical protein [Lactobacillus crispatus]|uniref:hypothetical protein n=1 Tax=Lactobacillus crispatus TaxID=47770 RepID=UPI0021D4A356|nr:hypothetical protein [Lactobacillus crispatus]